MDAMKYMDMMTSLCKGRRSIHFYILNFLINGHEHVDTPELSNGYTYFDENLIKYPIND